MSEFTKGDLAMCIRDPQGDVCVRWEPVVGGVYTVAAVCPFSGDIDLEEDPHKFDPDAVWEWQAFRKIEPHVPDEFDAEIIDLLTEKERVL